MNPNEVELHTLTPQLNVIVLTPFSSPKKGHYSNTGSGGIVTIDPQLLHVNSGHASSPTPHHPSTDSQPIPSIDPSLIENAAFKAPPSRWGSSIDPVNPEGDFLRHLQGRVWSQAKHKLLRLQEGAVQSGDMSSLLKFKYWEQCVTEKNQQPDISYTVTADWGAFDRVSRILLNKTSE